MKCYPLLELATYSSAGRSTTLFIVTMPSNCVCKPTTQFWIDPGWGLNFKRMVNKASDNKALKKFQKLCLILSLYLNVHFNGQLIVLRIHKMQLQFKLRE